jgi:hypothetical protein
LGVLLIFCAFLVRNCSDAGKFLQSLLSFNGFIYSDGTHLFNAVDEFFAWKPFGCMVYNARLLFLTFPLTSPANSLVRGQLSTGTIYV